MKNVTMDAFVETFHKIVEEVMTRPKTMIPSPGKHFYSSLAHD